MKELTNNCLNMFRASKLQFQGRRNNLVYGNYWKHSLTSAVKQNKHGLSRPPLASASLGSNTCSRFTVQLPCRKLPRTIINLFSAFCKQQTGVVKQKKTNMKEFLYPLLVTGRKCTVDHITMLMRFFGVQCNVIAAQRIRRGAQISNFYHRLYDESSMHRAVTRLKHLALMQSRKRPLFLVAAVLFSWDQERITDEDLSDVIAELAEAFPKQSENVESADITKNSSPDLISSAACDAQKDASLPCDNTAVPSAEVKAGENGSGSSEGRRNNTGKRSDGENGWELLVDKPHLKVWRKPVPNSYLYEYRVYGEYFDIPARAFYDVNIDLEFRKKWDNLVVNLDVVDRDSTSGSEIVRWVTHYPFPMYQREFVYVRRQRVDTRRGAMVLTCRAVHHPAVPETKSLVRVHHYKSDMLIRPHRSFDENGFEYVLTYFDDPKSAFPTAAYNWMASTGGPDYVDKLHSAATKLHGENTGRSQSDVRDNGGGDYQ